MSKLKIEPMKHPDKAINYWKKEKFVVVCIIIFGISFNVSIVLGPIYQGKLIDAIATGGSLLYALTVAVTYLLIIGTVQLLRYFKRFYIRRFANSTSATMRLMIYNNIMQKSTSELDNENTGNLMTRAISDVDLCVEGMRKFTTEVFDTGVLMISYLVTMLAYDVKITLLSIIFVPVAIVIAEKLKSVIYKYSKDYRKQSSEVTDITYDIIENSILYRVTGMEAKNRARYNDELEDLQNKAIKANILENSMQPVYNIIAMIGIIMVIYLGGTKVIIGDWTVGVFSTYIAMFTAMAVKASKAAKLFNSVQKSQVSWKRIKPYLEEYKIKEKTSNINNGDTSLSVDNLSFSYGEDKEKIIEHISFGGKGGEIIGLTGSIASGKSTLGISLLGLYPYLGSIKIDGKELKDYSEYERSQIISYLGHKPQLLSDTIYNNITLGSNKDINSVLKDVCFDTDLEAMTNDQKTLVGNGGIKLSGGQQARIALARALLNKNKIIILDDPFSAVDMKTEEKIIENLKTNYRNSLIILISHRLAIFSRINNIILLKSDKTADYGTHDELMKKSEYYSTIYNFQCLEGCDGSGE
ncbi:ABC transporter ATP-binding protein [Clostridium fungisolvens]|uniref:Putative multidrug resistance ABC transporter ATP-binding/permease protein YheI n=1 Tax=Clostridium fungisolvens TaxID=1604897 RepID=A0A6V8SGQ7_9CLOT|nr:ABC transporter ATP-binding protein [Clostridium fungisolvens]GFP75906.1 putative multidrug resistance ABC transporter ATP-binding/permease protein YheI [Clostridium fungisolvens]